MRSTGTAGSVLHGYVFEEYVHTREGYAQTGQIVTLSTPARGVPDVMPSAHSAGAQARCNELASRPAASRPAWRTKAKFGLVCAARSP